MEPTKRWWNGLNLGWKRINYILIAICLIWLAGFFVIETVDHEPGITIVVGLPPLLCYLLFISIYPWVKEGFGKK